MLYRSGAFRGALFTYTHGIRYYRYKCRAKSRAFALLRCLLLELRKNLRIPDHCNIPASGLVPFASHHAAGVPVVSLFFQVRIPRKSQGFHKAHICNASVFVFVLVLCESSIKKRPKVMGDTMRTSCRWYKPF